MTLITSKYGPFSKLNLFHLIFHWMFIRRTNKRASCFDCFNYSFSITNYLYLFWRIILKYLHLTLCKFRKTVYYCIIIHNLNIITVYNQINYIFIVKNSGKRAFCIHNNARKLGTCFSYNADILLLIFSLCFKDLLLLIT